MTDVRQLDLAVPTTGGNSLITDIARWFVRDLPGAWLPTTDWVRALEAVEVPGPTARSSLSRITRAGFLERRTVDARPGYALSAAWLALMQGDTDTDPTLPVPGSDPGSDTGRDPGLLLVAISVPEERREDRHQLRTLLQRCGCRPMGNGLWLGSRVKEPLLRGLLEVSVLTGYVDLFAAEHLGWSSTAELVARCWDLDALAAEHRALADDLARLTSGPAARRTTPGEVAFHDVVTCANRARRLLMRDPLLPASVLPPDWPAAAARTRLARLMELRLPAARAWLVP